MANQVGFIGDFLARIKQAVPSKWIAEVDVVRDAILSAPAEMYAWAYAMLAYVKVNTRLATSMDIFLDIFAVDYFGPAGLLRKVKELDVNYANRIQASLLAPRGTRAAMVRAITNLTGRAPIIFETHNSGDTGGYGDSNNHVWSGLAYGSAGGYGGVATNGRPFQALITVFRPTQFSIPSVTAYGGPSGGYGQGYIVYGGAKAVSGAVSDAEIYAEVAKTMPVAAIGWTALI